MRIDFLGRSPTSQYWMIGVQADHLTDAVEFVIDAAQGDLDLSALSPRIRMQSTDGRYADEIDDAAAVTDQSGKIHVSTVLTYQTTSNQSVRMQVAFYGAAEGEETPPLLWQTEIVTISFAETINVDEALFAAYPTIVQKILQAAEAAEAAVGKIENLSATATQLPEGSAPTVAVTVGADDILLSFGIPAGDRGDSVFIRYSASSDGSGFSPTWSAGMDYIGVAVGQTAPAVKTGYQWITFRGEQGDSVFIRYSASHDGSGFSPTWSAGKDYMGVAVGRTAPTDKTAYQWTLIRGEKGDQGEQGEPGNVLYATFAVDPETGILEMTTPTGYDGVGFEINEYGELEAIINE